MADLDFAEPATTKANTVSEDDMRLIQGSTSDTAESGNVRNPFFEAIEEDDLKDAERLEAEYEARGHAGYTTYREYREKRGKST